MDIVAGLQKVIDKVDLTKEEMKDVMNQIMEGNATQAQIGAFLVGLRMKGETIDEITGAAEVMREKAIIINPTRYPLMDTVGTGGDRSGTFNISTTTSFIIAAAGVGVAKHGNRSVSSKSGSADVLEALGVNLNISPEIAEKAINETGMSFLFAVTYHKSMKHAIGPRKEIGVRTIFNVLGPLTNPALAKVQLMGVYSKDLLVPLAHVLKKLGVERAMVVHGEDGLDEVTISGKTFAAELKNGEITEYEIDAGKYFKTAPLTEIQGGDGKENAVILRDILRGEEKGPKRDIVLLNSGICLYLADKADTIEGGIKIATEIVDSGKALEKLEEYIKFTNNI